MATNFFFESSSLENFCVDCLFSILEFAACLMGGANFVLLVTIRNIWQQGYGNRQNVISEALRVTFKTSIQTSGEDPQRVKLSIFSP